MARQGSKGIGIAVAIALLLALAPPASASIKGAGGFKYLTKSVKLKPGKRLNTSLECPGGTRVIGGGETNNGGFETIVLRQTFPHDDGDKGGTPDDGWTVRAVNVGSDLTKVKVTAICGDTKLTYIHRKFEATGHTQTGDESISCPGNKFVYSGGFEARAKSQISLNSTFPESFSDTEWGGYVDNAGDATKVTVHAICGRSNPVEDEDTLNNFPGGPSEGVALATCPDHRFPVGGGVDNNGGFESVAINTLGPNGTRGWLAQLDKTAAFTANMHLTVICHKSIG